MRLTKPSSLLCWEFCTLPYWDHFSPSNGYTKTGGLRGYDNVHEIVYPIGATLFNYITGFGAIGSLVKFVISLNVNSAEGVGAILFVLFFLLPPSLWVVVRFHVLQEKKIIAKLKESDLGKAIFIKSISIE